MTRWIIKMLLVSLLALAVAIPLGCGDSSGISSDDHAQIKIDMTMDEVESILGQPERSHVTGSNDNPSIFWYFTKAEGDGLVKIAFEQGKVTTVAPYDLSFEVGE